MALVFAFPKLLSVICYLYRKKIIFGNCQLSTVTLVTQTKSLTKIFLRVLRVIRGFFLGSLKARNLLGKSCLRCCLRQEIF